MGRLDDKVVFCQAAEALGLSVPIAHRVCSHAEVRDFNEKLHEHLLQEPNVKQPRYILKNLQYDSMHRLDLFTLPCAAAKLDAYLSDITIDEHNPWTVQTFIVGEEYSTCAIVKDGRLLAFTDNQARAPARRHRSRRKNGVVKNQSTYLIQKSGYDMPPWDCSALYGPPGQLWPAHST